MRRMRRSPVLRVLFSICVIFGIFGIEKICFGKMHPAEPGAQEANEKEKAESPEETSTGGIKLSGYYKVFFTGFHLPTARMGGQKVNEAPLGAVNNHLRLRLTATPLAWMTFESAYDFTPTIQDTMLFQRNIFWASIDPFSYRASDFSERLYPRTNRDVNSFAIFHNLDRLMVTIKTGKADIMIGRQPIAWGSARFVNPTDIVAPFAFNELDKEERRGVDALRVRIPLGKMDEVDVGYIIGKKFKTKNSGYYLRAKTYLFKTDISALGMVFRDNLLIGLDLSRSIGGAGAWLEAAYVWPKKFKSQPPPGVHQTTYFRASAGMDYSFNGKLYGFFEYHFNSIGKRKPADYELLFNEIAFREGADYLLGKHYVNLGSTMQMSPLVTSTAMVILNIADKSFIIAPTVEYNISENIYLAGGAYLGIGKLPMIGYVPGKYSYKSEFGTYPSMVYTSFRVYF